MKYNLISADPPWRYRNTGTNGAAAKHYPTMSIEELCALPVADQAADDAVLLLWMTGPLLPEAVRLVNAWGFEFRTSFPWLKVQQSYRGSVVDAAPAYGPGFWIRANPESVFLCTRGQVHIPDTMGALVAHRTRHSAKPEALQSWAESEWPELTDRLEMFARRPRDGWAAFGNEGVGSAVLV